MLEQAKGESRKEKARKKEEVEVSIYEAINLLVAHGHDKETILRTYSRDELTMFYEKCIKQDMRGKADFVEAVLMGIGGAFGGGKKIEKVLADMRK